MKKICLDMDFTGDITIAKFNPRTVGVDSPPPPPTTLNTESSNISEYTNTADSDTKLDIPPGFAYVDQKPYRRS